jgi:hypothetical protein
MTCTQVLKMSSTEWIGYFDEKMKSAANDSSNVERASTVYGKCYEARTNSLAASLARRGKGPSKAAQADFAEFEAALNNFATKALADAQPAADSRKQALAMLYERQFRYEFYQQYEAKIAKPPTRAKSNAADAKTSVPQKTAVAHSSSPNSAASSAATDTDEMTKAKNRFGELLGGLPDDKLHELHRAFGEAIGLHALDEAMRLAVYHYAIFLLEPTTAEASYMVPF